MASNNLLEIAAYHESGHAIMATVSGYAVEYIRLDASDPGEGVTKINYGDDNIFVMALLYPDDFGNKFNSLPRNIKPKITEVGNDLHSILVAGSCSEKAFEVMVNSSVNKQVTISGPDLTRMLTIANTFTIMGKPFPDSKHQEKVHIISHFFSKPEIWNVIKSVAEELLKRTVYFISQADYEQLLSAVGFFQFLENKNLRCNLVKSSKHQLYRGN